MPKKGDTTTTSTGDNGGTTETTFTQADVDRIVEDRLKRERGKYADYDDLKAKAEAADTSKSDLEKLQATVTDLQKQTAAADERALKAEIAQAKGLSPAQAKRLSGSTKEELEADADELLEAFKPASSGDGENGEDGKEETEQQQPLGRPKEKLTPGASPSTEGDKSGKELAEEVWERTRGGL